MDFFSELPNQPSIMLDALMLVVGIVVGSYLNVLALRSLAEESVFYPPSKCPKCNHRLAAYDNIPILSWLSLGGKCRYCRAPIHWQYPLVEFLTGVTFVVIVRAFLMFNQLPFLKWNLGPLRDANAVPEPFLLWWYIAAALFFACTLIAVTITDFREKLIPHEITYPAMIVGIIFSSVVRHDFFGAMTGIGVSYLFFDFIAFYGLKWYQWMHGTEEEPRRRRRLKRRLRPSKRRKLNRSLRWRLDLASIEYERDDEEPMEVMGGGDAVLSAVMSAFLGWQLLLVALAIGFVVGTMMGLVLLFKEMAKAKLLHKVFRQCLVFSTFGATAFGVLGFSLLHFFSQNDPASNITGAANFAGLGVLAGVMLGIVRIGTTVSKPYPFGPALALGGLVATFLLPNWLY